MMFHWNPTDPDNLAGSDFQPATDCEFDPVFRLAPPVVELTVFAMNTPVSYRIHGVNAPAALAAALNEMERLENLLSRFRPGSDIARLNHSAGGSLLKISPETMSLLSAASRISEITDGSFNPMIGPLMDLWNFKHAVHPPTAERIRECITEIGACWPTIDPVRGLAGLPGRCQSLDLGGIAKGYAGDQCLEICKQHGIQSAFMNLGGNVATLGTRPDGLPWRVGIRHPRQAGNLLGLVEVCSQSVVTSGDYERCFIDQAGRRWHHLLDPRSGYPAKSGLTSATVIAADGMVADALSTALFVSGLSSAGRILSAFPAAEAVLVDERLRVFISSGLREFFLPAEGMQVQII
jgi:FAD:protein FMN transferase